MGVKEEDAYCFDEAGFPQGLQLYKIGFHGPSSFSRIWRGWIQPCLSSVEMSIIINGSPTRPFKMECGLRQGDPLSPFLFVLVADVLNRNFNLAVREGLIEGIKVGRNEIKLSHLQFADDTLLFAATIKDKIVNLRRILDCINLISSLQINFDKSALIPFNCHKSLVEDLRASLQCKVVSLPITYFAIPLRASSRRVETGDPLLIK